VLLDETDSFAQYERPGVISARYWPEVIPFIERIVSDLAPGDEFAVIGIDDHGFDEDDVIIAFKKLDDAFLRAKLQKDTLRHALRKLAPRKERYKSTDILGTLRHAAHFAAMDSSRQTIVFCFSDMRQEPSMPTVSEAADLRFPPSSKGYFFYVDAAGRNAWDRLIQAWEPILHHAGMEIGSGSQLSFFQRREVEVRLGEVLRSLNHPQG
jgi:hypothetical protein